ncbi:MAG: hypothetical protein KatS3mg008_0720 [Acidimicrobiales bacterium]|nr:MAG: hypothetical protein KatS3mg008_0720 [Acidimicrobiales bacterium]
MGRPRFTSRPGGGKERLTNPRTSADESRSHPQLLVDVSRIAGKTGERRAVETAVFFDDVVVSTSRVPEDVAVRVDVTVEAIVGGFSVTGKVKTSWVGGCRRCLEDVREDLEVDLREIYSTDPVDEDVREMTDEHLVDLTDAVREALMLELPLAPLCSPGCRGPDPERFPTLMEGERASREPDPRWAPLAELEFPSSS